MKVCNTIVVSALGLSAALADPIAFRGTSRRLASDAFPWNLSPINNTDSYHMKPVRVIQARVQGDMPEWNAEKGIFTSKYGSSFETKFRAVLDTVNTASVEGALMYVQAEGINYNTRSAEQRCTRKNGMKYVVFYDMVIAQTNATLAQYEAEYGPMLPMDGGRCTPVSGSGDSEVFPDACLMMNGNNNTADIGPFVGGELKETDERAPYPNTWWYSFPNTCPLKVWASKTDECRAGSHRGLCDYDKMPDGITCTFNYRILGFVPIDDVVGITAMKDPSNNTYANFSQFCTNGGIEFTATDKGVWNSSIDFWLKPQDSTENAKRATKLVDAYNNLVNGTATSTQVDAAIVAHFKSLPTVTDLAKENPPCYKNVKRCATATNGCKRELYGQICSVCEAAGSDCVKADGGFTFPTLVKAVAPTLAPTPSPTPSAGSGSKSGTPSTPTPSGATAVTIASVASVAASVALSLFL